jgi:hypothetical protein
MTGIGEISAASLMGNGTISIDGADNSDKGELIVSGAAGFGGTGIVSGDITLQDYSLLQFGSGVINTIQFGGAVQIYGPNAFLADTGALTTNGVLSNLATDGGTFTLQNGAVVTDTNAGGLTVGNGTNGAQLSVGNGASLTVFHTLTILSSEDGLTVGGGGDTAATLVTVGALANDNDVNIEGNRGAGVFGTLKIAGAEFGAGNIDLSGGGTLEVGTTIGGGATIIFDTGGGTLELDTATSLGDTLSGLGANSTVDFASLSYKSSYFVALTSTNETNGTLSIEDSANGNSVVASFNYVGEYRPQQFVLAADGGGTSVSLSGNFTKLPPPTGDFNSDAISDVLWFNPSNDTVGDWLMNNGTPTWQVVGQGSSTVNIEGYGDFTGNRTSDILWENPTNGLVGDWLMSNNVPTWQQFGVGSTTESIVGVGDFNGDGTSDILWQNPTNNDVGIWQMQNNVPTWVDLGFGSTTVNIAGVGDFTGNGKDDILWENPGNGVVGMWAISGSTPTWSVIGQGSTTTNLVGVGDFTGNGTDNILWENPSNGTVGFWGMTNGQATSWNIVATANTSYQVAGIGDYYGNGTDDILWRNASTGDTGIWQMNNGQATWHDLGIASLTVNPVKA